MSDDGLYALSALKNDPKSFRTKHIKGEIKKLENNKNIYQFSARCLPTIKITQQTIRYYASLAAHYSVDRLRNLPKSQTQLYLLCYVYH